VFFSDLNINSHDKELSVRHFSFVLSGSFFPLVILLVAVAEKLKIYIKGLIYQGK